ncbi:MAG: hypothetical protein ACR2IK_21150 [Chloroflexota bacterium]
MHNPTLGSAAEVRRELRFTEAQIAFALSGPPHRGYDRNVELRRLHARLATLEAELARQEATPAG